jgi:hypothetical protein
VATRRHTAAPNTEWVLMYRGGLTRSRIAALTRAPAATVGYHLAIARAADPGLQAAHVNAASMQPHVSVQSLARMHQLVAMVQETGRYPSRTAPTAEERTLAAWLERRRHDAAAGTLAPVYRNGLAVLPGWQRPPRPVADAARWQDRLSALIRYRAAGHDWPRQKAHHGDLDPAKAQALDEMLPGWRAGRQRGRKPRNGSGTSS